MPRRPIILALDIASGGVTACLIGPDLEPVATGEVEWCFVMDPEGSATLSATAVLASVTSAIRLCIRGQAPPAALVLSSMMHTLVVTSDDGVPRTPVYTWQDRREGPFAARVRARLGDYRARTGCHFHPSFPAFKLARLRSGRSDVLEGRCRIASLKGWVQGVLTGNGSEDLATASASGLLNLETGRWDPVTLDALDLQPGALPGLLDVDGVAGTLTPGAAGKLGLPASLPVVAGAGDGFLATTGSGCDDQTRAAVTLGTTAGVRRFLPEPGGSGSDGTFCYRFRKGRFLHGCAGSNGGNVLEWASARLGPPQDEAHREPAPIFLPFLNGERAPFWDAGLGPTWKGVEGATLEGLRVAAVESVVFQLGMYYETVSRASRPPRAVVVSGNGFALPWLGSMLAQLVPVPVFEPVNPGLATLRGAARCGFDALGLDTSAASSRIVERARQIEPMASDPVAARYREFRRIWRGLIPPANRWPVRTD